MGEGMGRNAKRGTLNIISLGLGYVETRGNQS